MDSSRALRLQVAAIIHELAGPSGVNCQIECETIESIKRAPTSACPSPPCWGGIKVRRLYMHSGSLLG
jgi:hypothetical protein